MLKLTLLQEPLFNYWLILVFKATVYGQILSNKKNKRQ